MSNNNNKSNQMPLALIATRILNVPLMITRAKLDQILHVVGERIGLDTSQIQLQYEPQKTIARPNYTLDDGIAIIPVSGSLVYKTAGFSGYSGLQSYRSIRDSFDAAMEDPKAKEVLFDISSSGGEVAGVFDLVDHIYHSRGRKPIYAMANESAYSAAYALASAADKIYLSRTAGVGSIGVVMIHVDRSEAAAKAGLKYTHIYAGSHKTDGSPYKPLSDTARAKAQATVDSIYDLFIYTVARNNGLDEEDVMATQADTYHGVNAIDIGLADAVLSYQEVIKTIKTQNRKPIYGGINLMPERNAHTEQLEEQLHEFAERGEAQLNEAPPDTVTKTELNEAVMAERTRCTTILESCALAKTPEVANDLIADGSSVETAHKMIMMILAERTSTTQVNSTVNPITSGRANALLADAKRRAEKTRAARKA